MLVCLSVYVNLKEKKKYGKTRRVAKSIIPPKHIAPYDKQLHISRPITGKISPLYTDSARVRHKTVSLNTDRTGIDYHWYSNLAT